MDDVNLAVSRIAPGMMWRKEPGEVPRLKWAKEQEDKDLADQTPDQERTMEVIRKMADAIVPGISFTLDTPGRYKEGKVSMLDV